MNAAAANIQLRNIALQPPPASPQAAVPQPGNPQAQNAPAQQHGVAPPAVSTASPAAAAQPSGLRRGIRLLTSCFSLNLWPKFGSLTNWIYATVAFVFGIFVLSYAVWTSKKDFHQFCLALNQTGSTLSTECQQCLKHKLTPPWLWSFMPDGDSKDYLVSRDVHPEVSLFPRAHSPVFTPSIAFLAGCAISFSALILFGTVKSAYRNLTFGATIESPRNYETRSTRENTPVAWVSASVARLVHQEDASYTTALRHQSHTIVRNRPKRTQLERELWQGTIDTCPDTSQRGEWVHTSKYAVMPGGMSRRLVSAEEEVELHHAEFTMQVIDGFIMLLRELWPQHSFHFFVGGMPPDRMTTSSDEEDMEVIQAIRIEVLPSTMDERFRWSTAEWDLDFLRSKVRYCWNMEMPLVDNLICASHYFANNKIKRTPLTYEVDNELQHLVLPRSYTSGTLIGDYQRGTVLIMLESSEVDAVQNLFTWLFQIGRSSQAPQNFEIRRYKMVSDFRRDNHTRTWMIAPTPNEVAGLAGDAPASDTKVPPTTKVTTEAAASFSENPPTHYSRDFEQGFSSTGPQSVRESSEEGLRLLWNGSNIEIASNIEDDKPAEQDYQSLPSANALESTRPEDASEAEGAIDGADSPSEDSQPWASNKPRIKVTFDDNASKRRISMEGLDQLETVAERRRRLSALRLRSSAESSSETINEPEPAETAAGRSRRLSADERSSVEEKAPQRSDPERRSRVQWGGPLPGDYAVEDEDGNVSQIPERPADDTDSETDETQLEKVSRWKRAQNQLYSSFRTLLRRPPRAIVESPDMARFRRMAHYITESSENLKEKKKGPAHAYQFGNTVIVEDEDGEVIKTYTLPPSGGIEDISAETEICYEPLCAKAEASPRGPWMGGEY